MKFQWFQGFVAKWPFIFTIIIKKKLNIYINNRPIQEYLNFKQKGGFMTYSEWSETFSDNLKSFMKEKNISVTELSNEIGLSHQCIYGYLQKRYIPSAVVILNIAHVLDCDVSDLIDFGDRVK